MTISGIVTLAIALLGAFLGSPWGAGLASGYANHLKQTRALARIKGFGRVKPGSLILFYTADAGGGSALLGGEGDPWHIEALGTRIELSRLGWAGYEEFLQMTAAEFEAGTAVVLEDDDEKSG